tara:strand:- start:153 stop:341 length:189 start_codon:yes stop_codon:yes gene_type:complete
MPRDKRKTTIYLTDNVRKEIEREAKRLDRTTSWLLRKAWLIAQEEIKSYPSIPSYVDDSDPT